MNRAIKTFCTLLAAALLGCTGSGFEGDGDNQDQGPEVAAKGGDFSTYSVPKNDTCGVFSSDAIGLQATEVTVAADGKKLEFDTSSGPMTCTSANGAEFDCTIDIPPSELPGGGVGRMDAKMTMRWSSEDRFSGMLDVSISCTGANCDGFAEAFPKGLPCRTTGELVAIRSMPDKFVPQVGAYNATVGEPTLSTCAKAPPVPVKQSLRIEANEDGTAKVFADSDPIPHDCQFEGSGRTSCSRVTETDMVETSAVVGVGWTTATAFEGAAIAELKCKPGADCSGSDLGLPCMAFYSISGTAAGKTAP